MSGPGPEHTLVRYFALLDARDIDGLLALFAPTGTLISPGTNGLPLGGAGLKEFFQGLPPAAAHHVINTGAQNGGVSLAEGLSRPLQPGPARFFLASALLDDNGLITRFTTLVGDQLSDEQERAIVPSSA